MLKKFLNEKYFNIKLFDKQYRQIIFDCRNNLTMSANENDEFSKYQVIYRFNIIYKNRNDLIILCFFLKKSVDKLNELQAFSSIKQIPSELIMHRLTFTMNMCNKLGIYVIIYYILPRYIFC
jgi:hypothetical protein